MCGRWIRARAPPPYALKKGGQEPEKAAILFTSLCFKRKFICAPLFPPASPVPYDDAKPKSFTPRNHRGHMRFTSMFAVMYLVLESASSWGAPATGFVRREGNRLMLEGESHYVAGANQYYLFYKSQAMTDDVLQSAAALGLNVLRTWAFCDGEWHDGHSLQPEPGVFNEASFKNLDYAIYRAEQMGIRLVFSLVNNWDAFGGMNAYVRWSKTAKDHDDFYTNPEARALFKDYVTYVLGRTNTYTGRAYKDEPGILMWELANEPRIAKSRDAELYAWIHEMAAHIKGIDAHHLVSTGSEGDYDSDLYATHQSPFVDVVSFHLYPEDWGFSPDQTLAYIRKNTRIAKDELHKPVFCGEFGFRNKSQRDEIYRSWYETFQTEGIDGALFWLLSGRLENGSLYPDYDGFTIYHPDSASTIPVIQNHSSWTQQKSGQALDLMPPHVSIDNWSEGAQVQGSVELRGRVEDDRQVKSVTVSLGGVERPASIENGIWRYIWDSREALDRHVELRITARDADDNQTQQTLGLEVANQGYREGSWQVHGLKEQDDGYNFVYFLTAQNQTGKTEQGHFTARFFLRPEGVIRIGSHYEASQVYQGHPSVSGLKTFSGTLQFIDVDLGLRSVEAGQYLGFKGQLSQADGGMKTMNDWSAGNLPVARGPVQNVLWLKDGQVIAGATP